MRRSILSVTLCTLAAACTAPTTDDDTDPSDTDAGDTDAVSADDTDDTDAVTADDTDATDGDGDGVTALDGDCDDGDDTVFPGAAEWCDGIDSNCDPADEAGLATFVPTATGTPTDVLATLALGDPLDLGEAGTLRLCGGSWTSRIGTTAAVSVTIEGPSTSRPTLRPSTMSFAGDVTFRGVDLTSTAITAGTTAATTLDDVVVSSSTLFLRGGTLAITDSEVRAQPNTFAMVSGSATPPLVVTVADSVVHDVVNLVGADIDLTVTGTTFTGSGGIGSPDVLFLEDSSFTSLSGSVSGDGTREVVLRRVVGTSTNSSFSVSDQASLAIEDCDFAYASMSGLLGIHRVDEVTLNGVDLTTSGASISPAIRLTNDEDGPMDVSILGLDYDGAGLTGASAIHASGPLSLSVIDSSFSTGTESALTALDTGDVTLTRCTFDGFDSGAAVSTSLDGAGGAVLARLGTSTLTLDASTFTDNSAVEGGAVYLRTGSLVVTASTFGANAARDGAGIAAHSDVTTTTIDDSTFEDNAASRLGGGVATSSYATTITGGVFRRNTGAGAAVWVNGTLTLTNVDLSSDADDNTPTDIGWSGDGASFDGVQSKACTTSGCS